ncbi:MAG TPA: hypothetical protein VLB44_27520 [Kofleriaceae bacterium]|nr:hypothetical protein [Kofleriaceae bacterium]
MDPGPLTKPDHLRDVPSSTSRWLAMRPAGLAALVLGIAAFVVVAVSQQSMWSTPDWRISVPAFALTAGASIASLARREKAYPLWVVGLGLAAAALVLGWFLMLAIVVGVTAILLLILHTVM